MASYASYASVASKPAEVAPEIKAPDTGSVENQIVYWMSMMSQITQPPENMSRLIEILRREMETPQSTSSFRGGGGGGGSGGGTGQRNFGGSSPSGTSPPQNWRSGFNGTNNRFNTVNQSSAPRAAFDTRTNNGSRASAPTNRVQEERTAAPPRQAPGRYQSRFTTGGNIEDKILNTVIGNKLNAFTPMTYNDTRDFIYQIVDSGETEFTRDFIEKVFIKATLEELYCALFAKLIAELAHKYPVIYEEINKYNKEFLKIFDDVQEDSEASYEQVIKQKQYRMGYGQFIAELTGLNALEKTQLTDMVSTVVEKICMYTQQENRSKVVEEFIDCLLRLTKGLRERYVNFFKTVKGELSDLIMEKINDLILRKDTRPSMTNKARFGLMDLRDILQ
jgi:hypothetical protein